MVAVGMHHRCVAARDRHVAFPEQQVAALKACQIVDAEIRAEGTLPWVVALSRTRRADTAKTEAIDLGIPCGRTVNSAFSQGG